MSMHSIIDLPTPTVTDNSGAVRSLECNIVMGSVLTQDTTVIWTAEDFNDNTAQCSRQITIQGRSYQVFSEIHSLFQYSDWCEVF